MQLCHHNCTGSHRPHTYTHKKLLSQKYFIHTTKPRVTAGLKCAPLMCPNVYIIDITIQPVCMHTRARAGTHHAR